MQTRTRLRDVELVGARAWIRRGWFGLMIALSAIGAIGYLLPAHKLEGDEVWHSNFADGGEIPLLVFGALAGLAFLLRKCGLGAGSVMGLLATAGAIASVVPVVLVHLFATVQNGIGEGMYATGVLGLFFGGALYAIAEPILYLTQRRADERVELVPATN
ncbi:MAG: hypothetical protein H0V17_03090 [Deltaproteobacteria bacterium]|nr:hypothetical protein [Deltaproteobacteria bacterium]